MVVNGRNLEFDRTETIGTMFRVVEECFELYEHSIKQFILNIDLLKAEKGESIRAGEETKTVNLLKMKPKPSEIAFCII